MTALQQLPRSRQGRDLPAEIYVSLIDALFNDARSLFIGSMVVCISALITAWKSDSLPILLCAIAMAIVACVRLLDMRAYSRVRSTVVSTQLARRWELRYVAGAAATVSLLGIWCVTAFASTADPFVHLFSFSTTISYLVGITGRNFASDRLVTSQIVCAGTPLALALLLAGGMYYVIFVFMLVPFFVSMKFISDRLRATLLDAVISGREKEFLASRFDAALNNMPHGLAMFDAEGHLVVANRRLAEFLRVSLESTKGATVAELMGECMRAGALDSKMAADLGRDMERGLSGKLDDQLFVDTAAGRTLAFTFEPMESGGSVVLIEDITERRNAEARINHLARYDALTGLPNRTFFRDKMAAAAALLQRGDLCAVHFIDLDQFKQVNDTLGHPTGDELLCAVADRLRRIVGSRDIVGRFAGDEFVVFQSPARRQEDAASLARLLIEGLSEAYEINGHQVVVGASIGIAMAAANEVEADLLLRNADMALYRAKSDGRSVWRFFEPEMDERAQARRSLELDLRHALADRVFELHYQPLINLKTRRITTCEALLRWPHPTRGMVSPAEFIPVAEEMGVIVEIGNWVLREACIECTRWPDDVRVAVNLSAIQFRRGNVVRSVREALAVSGLPAGRLEVEITETVLLQDTEATRAILLQLRNMGVRISLDDFGTGYSSLSYLHSFPLHKVKIDRSFLQGIEGNERSLTLLRGVAQLSVELGMSVTLEGVETEEQLLLVACEANIDEAQGFLFSRALPSREIRKLLSLAPAPMEKVA